MKCKRVLSRLLTTAVHSITGNFHIIDFHELYYVGFGKRQIVFVYESGTAVQPITLKDIREFGFYAFSRKNLVNLSNYESFDAVTGEIRFKSGVCCKVAAKYTPILNVLLDNIAPVAMDWPMLVLDRTVDDVVQIALRDVDFVDLDGRIPIYNIGARRYRHLTLVEDYEYPGMVAIGYVHADRGSFVNLRKVTRFDRKRGRLYFGEDGDGVYASVAHIHCGYVEETLERIK